MSEIHDTKDNRNLAIKNVGVCDYVIPFTLKNKNEEYITVAKIKSGVSIDSETKGAHLSRIVMTLDKTVVNNKLTLEDIANVCKELSKEVGVDNANLLMNFNITIKSNTPKSNNITYLTSDIELYYKVIEDKVVDSYIKIGANGAMLCPNSKSKSKYGAHSQKCALNVILHGDISNIDLKEIYLTICNSTSAPVYGVVRSEDEVYMTELAYDNPKFSEDAIRDLILSIKEKYNGRIEANLINYESIHQHNVYCEGDLND